MEYRRAISFDLDDTIIGRGVADRLGGVLKSKVKPPHKGVPLLASIPEINHDAVNMSVRAGLEAISLALHARRNVLPGVKEILEEVSTKGIDIFGNTGRSNKQAWVDMTMDTLARGQVASFFQRVFFTPDDTRSSISKIDALRQLRMEYNFVEHYEDDPQTARNIAALFPEITVFLITNGTTGMLFSKYEVNKFPNIKRVGFVGEPYRIKL